MKETGVMFKAPLVRAILNGSKTQTRRVVAAPRKRESFVMLDYGNGWWPYQSDDGESGVCNDGNEHPYTAPCGKKGDLIYVRETWLDTQGTGVEHRPDPNGPLQRYAYAADTPTGSYGDAARKDYGLKWKPSIHMPKTAARIWLEITAVRVERLHDMSASDAVKDGGLHKLPATGRYVINQGDQYFGGATHDPIELFRAIWESTGADWNANPWVWVYEFKRIERTTTV